MSEKPAEDYDENEVRLAKLIAPETWDSMVRLDSPEAMCGYAADEIAALRKELAEAEDHAKAVSNSLIDSETDCLLLTERVKVLEDALVQIRNEDRESTNDSNCSTRPGVYGRIADKALKEPTV